MVAPLEDGGFWADDDDDDYVPTTADLAMLAEMTAMGRALLATSRNVSVAGSHMGDAPPLLNQDEEEELRMAYAFERDDDSGLAGEYGESGDDEEALGASLTLTEAQLAAHDRKTDALERRQFNCAAHGAFWKQVLARKPVARCPGCRPEQPRLEAVPREEERGRGFFRCGLCANNWTSNSAVRGIAQYCQAPGCDAIEKRHGAMPTHLRGAALRDSHRSSRLLTIGC